MHNLIIQHIEDEMWRDAVAHGLHFELHDTQLIGFHASAVLNRLHDEEHDDQQDGSNSSGGKHLHLLQFHILMLHRQVVVQLEGILRESLHHLGCPHVDAAVFQGIVLLHIFTQVFVCLAVISHCPVVQSEIMIANLTHGKGHHRHILLGIQNAGNCLHIMLLHSQSDADGVTIVNRYVVCILTHIRLYLIEIFLRLSQLVQIEIDISHIEFTEIHIEGLRFATLFQQILEAQKQSKGILVVLRIIIIISVVVQIIGLHRYRHLIEILLRLLIILKRRIKIVELQVDGSQSQIEGDIFFLRQIERVNQKQRTAIPLGSLGQLVLGKIGISHIGTYHRRLVLGIAGQRQAIGFQIESQRLISFLMEVVVVGCLRVVGKGKQTVAARRLGLLLGKLDYLIYIRNHGIGC